MSEATFVGIDVSKKSLEVHVLPSGEHFSVNYDEAGLTALIQKLKTLQQLQVILMGPPAAMKSSSPLNSARLA